MPEAELRLREFLSKTDHSCEVVSQFGSHKKVALTSARSRYRQLAKRDSI